MAPAESCPEKKPALRPPDFYAMILKKEHFQQDYLDYFNSGGVVGNLAQNWLPEYVLDLTNDGVPEYIIRWGDVFVLGCHSGKFQILLDIRSIENNGVNGVEAVGDANLNGVPRLSSG